jgi:hypothetical protein
MLEHWNWVPVTGGRLGRSSGSGEYEQCDPARHRTRKISDAGVIHRERRTGAIRPPPPLVSDGMASHLIRRLKPSRAPATLAAMLDALSVPPRLIVRAFDDLHALAEGIRSLTDREGVLTELRESVRVLPRTEDELSANIAALRDDIKALHGWLQPLHKELTDLDDTAEALERSMTNLQAILKKLPGV